MTRGPALLPRRRRTGPAPPTTPSRAAAAPSPRLPAPLPYQCRAAVARITGKRPIGPRDDFVTAFVT